MTPYGPEHLAVLAGIVVLAVVLVVVTRKFSGSPGQQRMLQGAGWLMLVVTLGWTAWGMLPGNWNIDQSLPLHYSDALRVITSVALITRAGWAIAVTYFWGLTLNLQSVITPDLNYFDYPVLEFTMYWFLHITALLVPIVFVWGLGYRPTWRGFGVAYAAVLVWAGIAAIGNVVTGAKGRRIQ